MKMTYFKTVLNFAPNNAPGLDVGTRLNETSAGTKRNVVFNVILSDNLIALFI